MRVSTILAKGAIGILGFSSFSSALPVIEHVEDTISFNETSSLELIKHQGYNDSSDVISTLGAVQWVHCKGWNSDNSHALVKNITLEPNPPIRGQDLNIDVSGSSKKLEQGTTLRIKVIKLIPIATFKFDLCEILDGGCPFGAGDFHMHKAVPIASSVPTFSYKLKMETLDSTGKMLSCVQLDTTITS